MPRRISDHIRANIVGYVAVFLAMGGVSYAAGLAPDSVRSKHIMNGEVKVADIASNAVKGGKVADGSLSGADLAANSVGGPQVDESTLDATVLQKRVTGTCTANQSIREIAVDGTVTCEPDDSGSGGPPSGTAGGDLAGTYPNPTIGADKVNSAKIANGTIAAADLGAGSVSGGAAGTVTDNSLTGTDIDESTLDSSVIQKRVSGVPCPIGQALTNIAASGAASCAAAAGSAWSLTGNAGTNPATNFLGTTDNQPLNLKVNGNRAFRLEPTNAGPNVIGGAAQNVVSAGVTNATIAGGGTPTAGQQNKVTDASCTVGGGFANQAGDNAGTTTDATVGGGGQNIASGQHSTVGGGVFNTASGADSTVPGGNANVAGGTEATVGGGRDNTASGVGAAVGGGYTNTASSQTSAVGGGNANTASGKSSAVGGGDTNTASGWFATVPGGINNSAAGDYSFAGGSSAKVAAAHLGTFLWAGSDGTDFNSAAANEFAVRAGGGFRFRTARDLSTGCNLPAGSGTFSCTSDRHTKRGFRRVNGQSTLDALARVPVTSWVYKSDPASVRHIGPVAQDFHRAFGYGTDNKTIDTVDAQGVALAAIKGLDQKVRSQGRKLRSQERRIASLERAVAQMSKP